MPWNWTSRARAYINARPRLHSPHAYPFPTVRELEDEYAAAGIEFPTAFRELQEELVGMTDGVRIWGIPSTDIANYDRNEELCELCADYVFAAPVRYVIFPNGRVHGDTVSDNAQVLVERDAFNREYAQLAPPTPPYVVYMSGLPEAAFKAAFDRVLVAQGAKMVSETHDTYGGTWVFSGGRADRGGDWDPWTETLRPIFTLHTETRDHMHALYDVLRPEFALPELVFEEWGQGTLYQMRWEAPTDT